MKKILVLTLALLMLLLAACGNNDPSASDVSGPEGQADVAEQDDQDTPDVEEPVGEPPAIPEDEGEGDAPQPTEGYLQGEGFEVKPPDGWDEFTEAGLTTYMDMNTRNNFNFTIVDKDPNFAAYDQSVFEEAYSQLGAVEFNEFSEITVSDCPAYKAVYTLSVEEGTVKQYQYMVDAPDSTITFTFTEVSGDIGNIVDETMNTVTVF